MDCPKAQDLFSSLIDAELDDATRIAVEQHIQVCAPCQQAFQAERQIKQLIVQRASRPEVAPAGLCGAILRELDSAPAQPSWPERLAEWVSGWRLTAAYAVGTSLVILMAVTLWYNRATAKPQVVKELVNCYKYSSSNPDAVELTTSKPDEVALWFARRLDLSVSPPRFDGSGYRLVGARLCHELNRKAATLFYQHQGQQLAIHMFDRQGIDVKRLKKVEKNGLVFLTDEYQGYRIVLWVNQDMICTFVSNLDQDKLMNLAYQSAVQEGA